MADLKQELERLATRAAPSTPPEGLWSRGLRRHRRRRAAAVAGATLAAVLVGTLAAVAVQSVRSASAPVAGSGAVAAIPTRVDAPSAWLPAADPTSPIGPLAVVLGAERKSLVGGSENGLVGISARTGTYRFLDLPDQSPDGGDSEDVALSPDGRWIAYWQASSARPIDVVGAAAYDTRTGAVRRLPLRSRLGVFPMSLSWIDEDRLLVGWAAVDRVSGDTSSGSTQPSRLWEPAGGARTVGRRLTELTGFRPAPGGLSASDGTAVELLDGGLRTSERHPLRLLQDQSLLGDVAVTETRDVALVVADAEEGRNKLLTGRLHAEQLPRDGRGPAPRPPELRPVDVGTLVPEAVLAAPDARHLLVLGHVGTTTRGVYSVDLPTGTSRRVMTVPSQVFGADVAFASDLWERPPVQRLGAPWTPDPRLVALSTGAVVLLGFTWWRRRRGVV